MSDKEKALAEKIAGGLSGMPDAAGNMFLYGAQCLKTGYDLGVAAAKEQEEPEKEDES